MQCRSVAPASAALNIPRDRNKSGYVADRCVAEVRNIQANITLHITKSPLTQRAFVELCHFKKIWSGRRDSNPRPRPWQGRALPLSYTRIRAIGGDTSPATGRAMPNAALECNSPRMVQNRPDGRLSVIMGWNCPKRRRKDGQSCADVFWAGNLAPADHPGTSTNTMVWRGCR